MLNQKRLREVLDYDIDSGAFTWRVKICRKVVPGTPAGSVDRQGYGVIGIDGRTYRAHRLAFMWVTGSFPRAGVDHKDGVRTNNAWANLREADHAQNGQNLKLSSRNTSGLMGVSWDAATQKWRAQIRANGKTRHLGVFTRKSDASAAYAEAKSKLHTFNRQQREESISC